MPGRPILQKFCRRVEALGGEEFIYSELGGGYSYNRIATLLGVDRRLLASWRNMTEERAEKCKYWRRKGADAIAEQSVDDLEALKDDPDLNSAKVSLARASAQGKRWMASKLADKWSDRTVVDINVNADSLFLDVIQERSRQWLAMEQDRGPLESLLESGDIEDVDFIVEGDE